MVLFWEESSSVPKIPCWVESSSVPKIHVTMLFQVLVALLNLSSASFFMQSNEMVRYHPFPPVSVSRNNIGRCPAINLNLVLSKESTPTKDVGTTVDKTMIPV